MTDEDSEDGGRNAAAIMLPDGRPAPRLSIGSEAEWWISLKPFCDEPKRRAKPSPHVIPGLYWKWVMATKLRGDGFSLEQISIICESPKGHVSRMIKQTQRLLSQHLQIRA